MSLWDDFVELTQIIFAPLEDRFGFKRLSPSNPFIYYDSPTLRISLFYDTSRGCELDMGIMRKADIGTQKPSYGLSPLMAIYDPEVWKVYRGSYPNDKQSLRSSLLEMKELLFKYGASILVGDETDLDRCDALQKLVEEELGKPASNVGYMDSVEQVVLRYHGNA